VSDIVPCQVHGWRRVCGARSFRVTPSDLSRSNLLGAVSVRSANRTVTAMCARNRVGQGRLDYMARGTRSSISRAVPVLPSNLRWRKGSCGSLILPQGPYGSVQDQHRRLKRLAIACWPRHMGMPSWHKGWAGSKPTPLMCAFPLSTPPHPRSCHTG
jgi:hypothetical protein